MAGYGTDQGFTTWAADNGLSMPLSAPTPAVLRQRGSVYIDGLYGQDFVGVPADGYLQERAWPRVGACVQGRAVPPDLVPVAIEHASYHAAFQEAVKPGSLAIAVTAAGALKRKKIGPLEKEYFEGSGDAVADGTLKLSAVEGLLAPFFAVAMPAIFVA